MLYHLWKLLTRELFLSVAFWMSPERKHRVERLMRGKEELRRLRLADAVIVSFGKSGRTWLRVLLSRFFQLRYRLRTVGLHRLRQPAPAQRRHPAAPLHPRQLSAGLHRQPGQPAPTSTTGRSSSWSASPADVAVSQYFQWKFRMRPHKKGLNNYPEHGRRGQRVRLRDGRGRRAAQGDRVHERLDAGAAEGCATAGGALRGPAGRHGRRARARCCASWASEPTDAELQDCVAFASVENMRKLEEKSVFWLAGSAHAAEGQEQPELLQGAARQGRRLPRLFRRRAGRPDRRA